MPTRVLSPRSGGTKPRPWNVSPGLVAPEWRWAWDGLRFADLIWGGGGFSRDLITNTALRGFDSGFASEDLFRVGSIGWYHEVLNNAGEWQVASVTGYPFTQAVVMRGGNSNNGTVFDIADSSASDVNWAIHENGNNARIFHRNGTSPNTTLGTISVAPPDWHTVVIVHRAADDHELFVDGQSDVTDSQSSTFSSSLDRTTTGNLGDSSPSNQWDGDLALALMADRAWMADEVRQWDRDPFGPFRRQQVVWVGGAKGAAPPPPPGLSIPIAMHHLRQQG